MEKIALIQNFSTVTRLPLIHQIETYFYAHNHNGFCLWCLVWISILKAMAASLDGAAIIPVPTVLFAILISFWNIPSSEHKVKGKTKLNTCYLLSWTKNYWHTMRANCLLQNSLFSLHLRNIACLHLLLKRWVWLSIIATAKLTLLILRYSKLFHCLKVIILIT